jgi:DNA-directed RNA polymerase subunit M/transcription elongation factor TFIIS
MVKYCPKCGSELLYYGTIDSEYDPHKGKGLFVCQGCEEAII